MLSRTVTYVLLFLFGVVIGGVGTIAHQTTFTAGIDWPWALVLSLVAYASLLVGLRMLGHGRIPTLIAALGTIVMVLLFTQKSAGGSVLIPNNALGMVWFAGPIVIAAIVLAWPDVSGRQGAPHSVVQKETA